MPQPQERTPIRTPYLVLGLIALAFVGGQKLVARFGDTTPARCNPASVRAVHERLNTYRGDPRILHEVEAELRRILDADRRCAPAYVEKARWYSLSGHIQGDRYDQGFVAQASRAINHALALDPNSFEAHVERAYVSLYQRDFGAARIACDRAAELQPDQPEVDLLLGILANRAGDTAAAELHANAVLDNTTNRGLRNSAYEILADAYWSRGEFDRVVAVQEQALAMEDSAWRRHDLARALMAAKQYDRAIATARSALEQMDFPAGWQTLGQAYAGKARERVDQGALRNAAALYEQALHADPTNARARTELTEVRERLAVHSQGAM